jgi:hypothetical protein
LLPELHHLLDLDARLADMLERAAVKGLLRPSPSAATLPGAIPALFRTVYIRK